MIERIERLEKEDWIRLCEEAEYVLTANKGISDRGVETYLRIEHPDFALFLIGNAVRTGRDFLGLCERLEKYLAQGKALLLYGLREKEFVREIIAMMTLLEPNIREGVMATAAKRVFPELERMAFTRAKELANAILTEVDIGEESWQLAENINQQQFAGQLCEFALQHLADFCRWRISELKLQLEEKRKEERKLQLEKEEKEREQERQKRFQHRQERIKAILVRPRVPVRLGSGFELAAISIKSKEEIGLLTDGTVFVMAGRVYRAEKSPGGQVSYASETGARIVGKQEVKKEPKTPPPLPNFNWIWVVSSNMVRIVRALEVPREFLKGEILSTLKDETWIVSESSITPDKLRLYELSANGLIDRGFCRQATKEEKRLAKKEKDKPPCLV